MNSSTIWHLFGLFFLMLIFSSLNFWKDVFSSLKKLICRRDNNETDKTVTPSSKFEDKQNSYLRPLLTELNNRTRWYSNEIWHVSFAYIGITALAIGQVIEKKLEYLTYMFAASAVLGLFVVWHMTRLRRSERKNIQTLALIEEEYGVPKDNRAKANLLPKPFQFAIILVVFFYGFMACLTFKPG